MDAADPEPWTAVQPHGLAAGILGVTIFFTVICVAVIALRIWIRVGSGTFGVDDWLMVSGTVRLGKRRAVRVLGAKG